MAMVTTTMMTMVTTSIENCFDYDVTMKVITITESSYVISGNLHLSCAKPFSSQMISVIAIWLSSA